MATTARLRTAARRAATVVAAGLILLAGSACGGDDDESDTRTEEDADGTGTGAGGEDPAATATDAPVTVETLTDACDAFTDVITGLRGEAPESVDSNPVTDVDVNGQTYRSAECSYLYAGDDFSDQNRLSIQVNHADGMTPAQKEQMWDTLSVTEPVAGVGDEAQWYYKSTLDVSASARALVGDTVVILRTTVPIDLEGAPWIAKDPMVAGLQEILTVMAGDG